MKSILLEILKIYVRMCSYLHVYTFGLFLNYSEEHKKFLLSGFTCANCKEFLIKKILVADVIVYDENEKEILMLQANKKGKKFSCPRCKHKWEFKKY